MILLSPTRVVPIAPPKPPPAHASTCRLVLMRHRPDLIAAGVVVCTCGAGRR